MNCNVIAHASCYASVKHITSKLHGGGKILILTLHQIIIFCEPSWVNVAIYKQMK